MSGLRRMVAASVLSVLVLTLAACGSASPAGQSAGGDQPVTSTPLGSGRPTPGVLAFDPDEMDERYGSALPLFAYDPTSPLELSRADAPPMGDVDVQSITFASSTGEAASGVLLFSGATRGAPGVVMLFPGPGADFADRAATLAEMGTTVFVIDPPQAKRDGELTRFLPSDRDEQIELMIQLQRAVDVLAELGADANRLAFVGYSWGCAMGAQLAGIERRIGSYVLMYCDGGPVSHFTGADDLDDGPYADLSSEAQEAWVAAMEPIEPLYFVRHAAPAALFIQNATHDEVVRAVDAELLHEHASEPKEIRWYASGHEDAPASAWCDQAHWVQERLGLTSAEGEECSP